MIGAMLGKTLVELDAMPNNEYHQWRAYIVYRNAQMETARNG